MHQFTRALRSRLLLITSAAILPISVCIQGENSREFRDAAVPGVESGIETIVGGVFTGDETALASGLESILGAMINGVFDVLQPD